ncbi:hypothetical protein B0H13DRAFT_1880909 [Mycena leptocephala]|nr:hypothetical protein B0H13DRAFT_1880909 [Mycena leptocephala]
MDNTTHKSLEVVEHLNASITQITGGLQRSHATGLIWLMQEILDTTLHYCWSAVIVVLTYSVALTRFRPRPVDAEKSFNPCHTGLHSDLGYCMSGNTPVALASLTAAMSDLTEKLDHLKADLAELRDEAEARQLCLPE